MIQQIRLYCNGPTLEEFKYCMEATDRRDVSSRFSWKEKNSFFKSRCKTLLFNFESFLTLKGPSFPDLVRPRERVESAFVCNLCYLKTNNNEICYYHTTSEILSTNIKTLELFLAPRIEGWQWFWPANCCFLLILVRNLMSNLQQWHYHGNTG